MRFSFQATEVPLKYGFSLLGGKVLQREPKMQKLVYIKSSANNWLLFSKE